MKRRYKFLIVFAVIFLFWIGSMCYCSILTLIHGNEFTNLEAVGFDFLHPWEGEPEVRVLSYSSDKAEVYYYKETGGEKVPFVKHGSEWKYENAMAIWTNMGGSASDYLIWPYFKNYVP